MSPLLLIMEEAFAPYFSPQRTQSPQSSMMAKGEARPLAGEPSLRRSRVAIPPKQPHLSIPL